MTNKVVNSFKYILFLSFSICDAKFELTLNVSKILNCVGLLYSLHALLELTFKGVDSIKYNSLLSFVIYEAKTGPISNCLD